MGITMETKDDKFWQTYTEYCSMMNIVIIPAIIDFKCINCGETHSRKMASATYHKNKNDEIVLCKWCDDAKSITNEIGSETGIEEEEGYVNKN